ncbi:unnamed protein product [Closterium sp. NIES-53]
MGFADQIDDMSEAERLDKYVSGLKYEIQFEVRRSRPTSFLEAVRVAESTDALMQYARAASRDGRSFRGQTHRATINAVHTPDRPPKGQCFRISKHEGLIKLPAWTPDYIEAPCVKAITIARHFNGGAQLFAVCLRELAVDTEGRDIEKLCAAVPPDLAELIRRYPDIFPDNLPPGLPPERPKDHKIQLEPGAQPTVRTQWRLTQPELEELRSCIGAVLLQDFGNGLQPIAYESRKLQAAERNYPIHDKEMLTIIHAFKLWRCYLVGADVTVRTDHKSLQYLRAQPNLNPRQIRWIDYMESHFIYRITYKKGANNIDDALTRPTVQSAAVLITHSNPLLTGLFTHGYTTDPFFTTGNHQQATMQKGDYYLKAGTDRVWVPAYRLLRELLIQEVHDSNFSGHFGVDKTQKLLHRQYYWPDSSNDVQRYVSSCRVCQAMKSTRQRPAGLLQPLEPPERPWQQVTMDFVTGMPTGPSGNDAVLVVVDRFTKMAHFAPCRTTITAEETARLFISTVVRLHGIPSAIISDRDPKFTSKLWKETWAQYGTKLQFSSAYHPQTDGQTERTNQTMEHLIRTNCPDPARWEESLAMFAVQYD